MEWLGCAQFGRRSAPPDPQKRHPAPLPSWVLQESSDQPTRTTWGSGSVEGKCLTEISSLTWKGKGWIWGGGWGWGAAAAGGGTTRRVAHLHLVADAALPHAVGGTGARPEVGEALDGEGVAAVPVPGDFEVQVAII